MKIEDNFVPYNLSLKLKEKGFDEPCLAYYVNNKFRLKIYFGNHGANYNHDFTIGNLFVAPLYQQVIDWFREKHGITIYTYDRVSMKDWCGAMLPRGQSLKFYPKETYYEALTKTIEEALKLIP